MNRKESAARFTLGTAAACCLLLASTAAVAQYNDAQGAGNLEPLGGQQAASAAGQQMPGGMPDVSGIQQKMQEQMMQQMMQQMQGAAPAAQMQGGAMPQVDPAGGQQAAAGMPDVSGIQQKMQEQMMQQMMQQMQGAVPAAQMQGGAMPQAAPAGGQQVPGGMPDVSGIQQQMQGQMMQQMMQQMQGASPAAQMQGGAPQQAAAGMPDMSGMQQKMQEQMMQQMQQQVQGAAPASQMPDQAMQQAMPTAVPSVVPQQVFSGNSAPQMVQPGGLQLDAALSNVKLDPAIQAAINQKAQESLNQNLSGSHVLPGTQPQFKLK
ncbi:hypothetical protein [Candidatus Electronema sp. PJ]|uniref:hypothetical protein n=1 Tax=Candidatus Electronema sp. PJ TaxID=3401572 RepID=UPI003AA9A393